MPNQAIELLAPAGKMDAFMSVIEAGADAVYLGGKKFNMRGLKDSFNFTDEELVQAAEYAHQNHRKIYITMNNLYNGNEMGSIKDYLIFLQEIGVDAIIVQDLGIVELCRQLELSLPLHASVQMGISNLEAVRILEDLGFERVILSKNVSLNEISEIARQTRLGIEYFMHGDLCISHTGQCYMSSLVFNVSGNRGLCRKPCRWPWRLHRGDEVISNPQHFLAHKDMCLYSYIPEMISAGVTSFKIEGRMRTPEFLYRLVSIYRRALDRYLLDPSNYQEDQDDFQSLHQHRMRDYSAGNLVEPLNSDVIGWDGKREPQVFSIARPLEKLCMDPSMTGYTEITPQNLELTVKIGSIDDLQSLDPSKIDQVILGWGEIRSLGKQWFKKEIQAAAEMLKDSQCKILVETPRIVAQKDLEDIKAIRHDVVDLSIDGVVVNDLGSLRIFGDTGLKIWAGYGLNTFNPLSAGLLQGLGVERITASLELTREELKMLLAGPIPIELMIHGPLPGLVSDFCIVKGFNGVQDCLLECQQDDYALEDDCGQLYRIATDEKCRNTLFVPYDLCLLKDFPELMSKSLSSIRIDAQFYSRSKLSAIVKLYADVINQVRLGDWKPSDNYRVLQELFPEGLSTGSWGNG